MAQALVSFPYGRGGLERQARQGFEAAATAVGQGDVAAVGPRDRTGSGEPQADAAGVAVA